MADTKISDLTAAASLAGADTLPVVQSGTNKKATVNQVFGFSALGDLLHAGAAGVRAVLSGNTTTTKKVLCQTGDGVNSAAPTWDTLTKSDVGLSNVTNNLQLTAANNLSDLASATTARTNLGLGTAATQNTSAFLQPTNNLSDVSNASTARSNLGIVPFAAPWRSGQYYSHYLESSAPTTVSLVANTNYAVPIYIPNVAVTEIGCEVTTAAAAGKLIRLGIYADGGGKPGNLVLDAGTIAADSTGLKTIAISPGSLNGWYWLVVNSDGAPVVRSSVFATRSAGLGATSTTALPTTYFTSGYTFGAFASSFGSATDNTGTTIPKLWLRY